MWAVGRRGPPLRRAEHASHCRAPRGVGVSYERGTRVMPTTLRHLRASGVDIHNNYTSYTINYTIMI